MVWKLINCPQMLQVTRALAKRFADMEPAPNDRPLSERRLAVYRRLVERGEFRPVTWASAFCKETGATYRVNGKHTSTMLDGLETIPRFFVAVEHYQCPTLDDVARLYSTFDSSLQNRTARDIYASFAGTVDSLKNIPAPTVALTATGMAYHILGAEGHSKSRPPERAEYLLEYPEFVAWVNDLYAGGEIKNTSRRSGPSYSHQHLRRLPVVAAAFACWSKDTPAATRFWEAVRDETGAEPGLPDRRLSRFLLTVRQNSASNRGKTADREMYVKSLHAWNAWRSGEATNLNYYADKPVPAVR